MITTSKAKFLCLAACLLWTLPLCAEQPPRAELLTAYRIGTTPPMANYLATHHPLPNAPVRVFPVRKPGSKPGHGGGGGGGARPGGPRGLCPSAGPRAPACPEGPAGQKGPCAPPSPPSPASR